MMEDWKDGIFEGLEDLLLYYHVRLSSKYYAMLCTVHYSKQVRCK